MKTFITVTDAFSNRKLMLNIAHVIIIGRSENQASPGDTYIKMSTGDVIEILESLSTLEEVLTPLL